jgi:hypothetical protein
LFDVSLFLPVLFFIFTAGYSIIFRLQEEKMADTKGLS